jgi:hypothetical protein
MSKEKDKRKMTEIKETGEEQRDVMVDEKAEKEWRGGVYMCTAKNSFEADIFESKLRGEGIPILRRYKGAGNFLEIAMGTNMAYPIDIYVPQESVEDARNIVVAIPLVSDDPEDIDYCESEYDADEIEYDESDDDSE